MRTSPVYTGLRVLILGNITPGMSVLVARDCWNWSRGIQESRRDSALVRQWSWTDWTVDLGGSITSTTFRRQAPHSFVLFPYYATMVDIDNPHSFEHFLGPTQQFRVIRLTLFLKTTSSRSFRYISFTASSSSSARPNPKLYLYQPEQLYPETVATTSSPRTGVLRITWSIFFLSSQMIPPN